MENKFKLFHNFSRKPEKSGVPEEVIDKNSINNIFAGT
jgi:hypothetical protein